MLQNIFSHRPPLYNIFDKAEFRALHIPWSTNKCVAESNERSVAHQAKANAKAKKIKENVQTSKKFFAFVFASFSQCEWALRANHTFLSPNLHQTSFYRSIDVKLIRTTNKLILIHEL